MKKKRLTKYDTHVEPRLIEIEGWARDGLIDEQIAKNLGVAYSTFKVYKDKHSALSATLKKGKEVIDREVENALLKKALGYKEVLRKTKVLNDGELISYLEEVSYPGDTTAQIFWLKNRKPAEWKRSRTIGKKARRNETDVIMTKLIPLAESQGSKNAGKLYMI